MEENQSPAKFPGGEQNKEECNWGMWLHPAQLANCLVPLAGLVAPIAIWQLKKDQFPSLDVHGKNVVNWMISSAIYAFVGLILMFVFVGFFVLLAVAVCGVVFPIIGGIKANNGDAWKYPLTISFLK
jgi:uncharacterized Tic20 family protein